MSAKGLARRTILCGLAATLVAPASAAQTDPRAMIRLRDPDRPPPPDIAAALASAGTKLLIAGGAQE